MKKINYIMLTIVIVFISIFLLRTKLYHIKNKIVKDTIISYGESIYVKDILNIDSDDILEKDTLGSYKYTYENDNALYVINYKVIDNTPPLILGNNSFTIEKSKNIDLVNKQICIDDYNDKPNCYIEGDYDINKEGTYNLKYIAIDNSNNRNEKNIKLIVKNKIKQSESKEPKKNYIKDIIKTYKNDDNKIGIDVSSWQGDVDYNKVKNEGIEFVIIRIGYGYNKDGEIVYDTKFKNNLKKAKEAGLDVGIYFYSYAKTEEESKEHAKWIINELNNEKLELGISFDWENWNNINSYNVSIKKLNNIAKSFMDELNNNGYTSYMYSSKYYLENIWKDYDKTWLAHYTDKTNYKKDYQIWQFTNTGIVNGINGYVDLDILYKNK